ncbi:MAG: adenine deaminase [Bacteroidia bacterium]
MHIQGKIVDLHARRIFPGEIHIEDGKIQSITPLDSAPERFIMPGFIDAHVHVESSMLVPSEFARMAIVHGTVATVSDPHEIANVLGVAGVRFMMENGSKTPFKFYFGAPSCVPATSFETAGAVIDSSQITDLLADPNIVYLAEMMNFPGVIHRDKEVMAKIAAAHAAGKPVDGHAPGLRGDDLKAYVSAGISTDHECFTQEEAQEKLDLGMKILIREGSAAKNFAALIPLMKEHADKLMFCSDDKHPDDLDAGHINQLAARAIAEGYDGFDVLRAACINPIEHYNLAVGQLRPGDTADFIITEDLESFKVLETWIDGKQVFSDGRCLFQRASVDAPNQFNIDTITEKSLELEATHTHIRIIEALDGELITKSSIEPAKTIKGNWVSDPDRDILKLVMVNRYKDAPLAFGFIRGFGLDHGAIASCVGHDSHNLIAVGADDESLCRAINLVIEHQGGIAAVSPSVEHILPLPVAGIMSAQDGHEVAKAYGAIDHFAKTVLQSDLHAPFMTLSFMGLLVIPSLKLSDKGLFDGNSFSFTTLGVDA